MALKTEHKLYIALGVLAVLGGLVFKQSQQQKEESIRISAAGRNASLPKLSISEEDTKKIDKIELSQPGGDAGPGEKVVLQKQGEEWKLVQPVTAKANDSNVKSLIEALPKLQLSEEISAGTDQYEKYSVSDKKALHAVAWKGTEKLFDLYFGDGGGRGQMTRIGGKDGVYAVNGYTSWTFKRDLKSWRDRDILKFDDKKVKTVELTNEEGTFGFSKDGEKWTGKLKGAKDSAAKEISKFDAAKVDDLVRAFKALSADDFGDGKQVAEVGLDKPVATLTFTLDDGARRELSFGANAQGDNRWIKKSDSDQIFSISSWAAGWATSKVDKFQKKEDKEKKDGGAPAASPPPGDAPPPMDMPQ